MSIRCTQGNSNDSNFTLVNNEQEFEFKVGEDIDIDAELQDGASADSYRINQRCELPEGLTFNDGNISGKINHVGLYRIDVIAESGNTRQAIKIVIRVVPDEAEFDENLMDLNYNGEEPEPGPEPGPVDPVDPVNPDDNGGDKNNKGCFGDITSTYALLGVLALAGVGLAFLAIDKKRRVR